MRKVYIGDAVYVDYDDFGRSSLILTTEDGYTETNRIVLEPEMLKRLKDYLIWLEKEAVG